MSNKLKTEDVTPIGLSQAKHAIRECMDTERQEGVRNTPLLLGAPGQGKTSIIEQFVDMLNDEREERVKALIDLGESLEDAETKAGAKWTCVSYRLAQCDPTDLKGVPVYRNVDGAEMCSFAPPQIFPMKGLPNSAEGMNVVIFLDELPQANPTIQNLAANIIDGKVGDYEIDMSRSFIVCAGNRRQDHAATYEIPRNVGNRLIRFDVKTGFKEWEEWAMRSGVHPMVIGYLQDKQSMFNEPPPENGYVYGTPRSWHKVSCQMKQMADRWFDEKSLAMFLTQGTVGTASAIAFYQWAKAAKNNYSIDEIMNGKQVAPPEKDKGDILYSLVLEATYRINTWMGEIALDPKLKTTQDQRERAERVVELLGATRVKNIVNIYKWLDNKGIDPAFQVLINKYQDSNSKALLRFPMVIHPAFKEAATPYENIAKKLLAMYSK